MTDVQYEGLSEYIKMIKNTRKTSDVEVPHTLFDGPPGTGKTMLAKLISSMNGRPMIEIAIETVLSRYTGESEHNFTDILNHAGLFHKLIAADKEDGPGCFIFFDEFDSIAASRKGNGEDSGSERKIMNSLLTWMDGFNTDLSRGQPWMLAATNHGDKLDSAIVSRFSNKTNFKNPDAPTIKKLIISRINRLDLSDSDWKLVTNRLLGRSGRDVNTVCLNARTNMEKRLNYDKFAILVEEKRPLRELQDFCKIQLNDITEAISNLPQI